MHAINNTNIVIMSNFQQLHKNSIYISFLITNKYITLTHLQNQFVQISSILNTFLYNTVYMQPRINKQNGNVGRTLFKQIIR